ncbi:hypothetical protein PR202_gb07494 [Eleusine coracana subsp. coracana]|uniref:Peroxidase n=1 Tax=Eleusine coracana subsp. coracana TaxID=191504 RepID=A0AAV5ECQ1_ELECO|nr:hypothetical protein PR202_gb07494 [Eleusine coracana subsp. coracana]
MASARKMGIEALMVAHAVLALATGGSAQLQYGFYKNKCNASDVEAVVQGIVKARFAREAPIVAYLLRLQFHECAVNKTAPPNLSVKGYDLIAAIKAELERRCPGVVSCSDIEILATRDAVALAGGPAYTVRTGRRDRRQSRASDVKLPGSEYTAAQAIAYYAKLGMSAYDTVLLLGAHTMGATDPAMDPTLASTYKKYVCPNVTSSNGNTVYLDDQWSAVKVDNNYYKNLQRGRGVLLVDHQNLYRDSSTRGFVDQLANNNGLFQSQFAKVLVKLSEVNVLTGTQGEIRKVCNKFN